VVVEEEEGVGVGVGGVWCAVVLLLLLSNNGVCAVWRSLP